MNETMKLILSLSLSGSILAGVLFAVKPLIKHKLSKTIQYYLWIVVLFRLVLPFSFEGSIMNLAFYGEQVSGVIGTQSIVLPMDGTGENTVNSPILPNASDNVASDVYHGDVDHSRYLRDLFNQYVFCLWIIGVIIAFTINMAGYFCFSKYLKQENKPATEEQNKIFIALVDGRYQVRLVRNRFVTTPMLIGIRRPCIIIPDIKFEEKQLQNILLHEISHLRRFDIAVKWLTMITTSIHWFNPLVYVMKKEMNRACELACDETVIRNFNSTEKQAYGDTLISVVADYKYPVGVLQATLCEEKKSLKQRLVAIMNYNKKSKRVMAFSVILIGVVILGALFLGACVGAGKENPPKLYINAEESEAKEALTGSYQWTYRGVHTLADSDHPKNFKYSAENIVSVTSNQQLIISTQKINFDKKYNFTIDEINVYKDDQLQEIETVEPSLISGNLYLQAPQEAGEYIYTMILNYGDKGTVNYGFVVRVDMLTFDLTEIAKYKTPYVGNNSKVSGIASRLPVPDQYLKQQYTSLKTKDEPYGLTIYYEPAINQEYEGTWPIVTAGSTIETNSSINALVAFCMIDNLDEVTFAFRNSQSDGTLDESKYDNSITFERVTYEEEYGDLKVLGENLDLLQDKLAGKKSAFKGLELYVWRKPELTGNNDLYYTLLMGTNRNKTKEEICDLNIATNDLDVIKQEFSEYSSDTYLFILNSSDIDQETMTEIGDKLSGVVKNAIITIGEYELE